ncbi:MAG: hypothetical protein V1899_09980 [Planctomycetota bacterium]
MTRWPGSVYYKERLWINFSVQVFKNGIRKKNINSFSVFSVTLWRTVTNFDNRLLGIAAPDIVERGRRASRISRVDTARKPDEVPRRPP